MENLDFGRFMVKSFDHYHDIRSRPNGQKIVVALQVEFKKNFDIFIITWLLLSFDNMTMELWNFPPITDLHARMSEATSTEAKTPEEKISTLQRTPSLSSVMKSMVDIPASGIFG